MKTNNAFGNVRYEPADIFTDTKSVDSVQSFLEIWFHVLGIDENATSRLVSDTLDSCKRSTPRTEDLEGELLETYDSFEVVNRMNSLLVDRGEQLFDYINPQMPALPCKVLDIGAGTGQIGKCFYEAGFDVALQDIRGYSEKRFPGVVALENAERPLPYYLHNPGDPLQFDDDSYDASLLMAVLHHCSDPLSVLEEAKRVTKQKIFVLESVYGVTRSEVPEHVYEHNRELHDLFFSVDEERQKKYQTFLDWFINKVSFRNNANVPFNFNSPQGWEKAFEQKELAVVKKEILGIDHPVTPEFHVLYVVGK